MIIELLRTELEKDRCIQTNIALDNELFIFNKTIAKLERSCYIAIDGERITVSNYVAEHLYNIKPSIISIPDPDCIQKVKEAVDRYLKHDCIA